MPTGDVVASVEGLPRRFLPERADGLRARFRLRIGRLVRDVAVADDGCSVEVPRGNPDSEISTSAENWFAMEAGRISGVEAFAQKRLSIRGSIQRSLLFEPLFERPDAGGMRYTVERIRMGHMGISALVAGDPDAPPVVLLHGLGGTKASMLTIVPKLALSHRVVAVDLPGFGSSSKPRGRYDAPWFADYMFAFLEEAGLDRVALVGNSMGGKIAQEMAMRDPERIAAVVCLCPATAFSRRPIVNLVRVLRPELGFAVGRIPRSRVRTTMEDLFAKPSRIDPEWFEAATDDFLRTWRSPRARMAFFAAARHIYLEEPDGERGFWGRLRAMDCRAFYIYGMQDVLISSDFGRKVRGTLPKARVEVWDDCGHVPQLEHPERTARAILSFLADASGRRRSDRPA
ncbi:MAG: alpha/beta fold hydrolase [Actinomycetota bacterium]